MAHSEARHKRFNDAHYDCKKNLDGDKNNNAVMQCQAGRNQEIGDQRTIHGKFKMGGIKDQSKIESAIVKNHHFMYHGQFKMCFRVIDRHAAIFNHGHYYQDKCRQRAERI